MILVERTVVAEWLAEVDAIVEIDKTGVIENMLEVGSAIDADRQTVRTFGADGSIEFKAGRNLELVEAAENWKVVGSEVENDVGALDSKKYLELRKRIKFCYYFGGISGNKW